MKTEKGVFMTTNTSAGAGGPVLPVLSRNWWMLALRGLAAIVFGVLAFVWPDITLFALVLLFGAYMLVDGIFAIVAAVRAAGREARWWLLVDRGSAWGAGRPGGGFLAGSYGAGATLLHRCVGDSEWHPRDSRSHKAQAGDRRGVGAWAERGSLFALWCSAGSDTSTRGSALIGVADRGVRAGLRSVAACSRLQGT